MKHSAIRNVVLTAAASLCLAPLSFAQDASSTAAQDKMFLKDAAEGNMAEISLSKMALSKSNDSDVKDFAQKMVTDHTMLANNMKPFNQKMGVKPPAKLKPEDKQEAMQLQSLSGQDFDNQYIKDMVANHHKDLAKFKSEESSTANPDLKAAVSQGEQVIQQHVDMIDQIAQKKGISTSSM